MNDFREISELYHHGIKGQKWGVINKKDDVNARVASEKNRLDYDAKIAKIKNNANVDLKTSRLKTKEVVNLGRQSLTEALAKESTSRKESYNERKTKERKYVTLGTVAVLSVLAATKISSNFFKNADKFIKKD